MEFSFYVTAFLYSLLKAQNRWVYGLCRSSGILSNQTTRRFGHWVFPSSGEGSVTATLLGPLERPNLNHWTNLF
jgi:hypothetical protein